MKHNFLSYALMLVAALSCTPVELTQKQEGEREKEEDGKTVIGAEICEDMARTSMGESSGNVYPIYWSAGDAINVNGAVSTGITISEKDAKHATFAFSAPFTGKTLYAVYPASRVLSNSNAGSASVLLPSIQTYASNNFDASTALMVGKAAADAANVPFSNVMAYLQIIPGGSATNISRVTVTARGGEKMCGLFNVDFTDKKLVVPSPDPEAGLISTRTASVVCDSPVSAGTPLIVAIPAQTYTQGIMVIIQDTEGHITQKSNKTDNLNFEAGKIYLMDGITFEASAKNASGMDINGEFDDWLLAPSVSYSLPEGAQYSDVRELKLAADSAYVYMYMELLEPEDIGGNGCRAMDIYIDADADPSTGADLGKLDKNDYFNNAGGLEWYLEPGAVRSSNGTVYSTLQGTNMYKWCGPSGFPALGLGYLKSQQGNYDESHIFGKGNFTLDSTSEDVKIGRYEVKLNRKYFGIFGNKAYFGVKYMLPGEGWPISGLLPQGKPNGGSRTVTGMAALALASPAYPANPITIDGNFDDWNNKNGWTSEFNLHAAATTYPELTQMKVVGTSSKVYAYFRLNYPGDIYLPSDLILDSDGNPNTGYVLGSIDNINVGKLFDPCGATWYIEGALRKTDGVLCPLNQFEMYEFNGAAGASPFGSLTNHGAFDESKMKSGYKISENKDIMEIEVEFDRGTYYIKGTKVGLGFKIMHNYVNDNTENVWMTHGIIPQKSTSATFVAGDLLRVNIPPYGN